MDKNILCLVNGKEVHPSQELLTALMPGVCPYRGAFETMRSYRGEIFALEKHLNRLQHGWKLLNIKHKLPITEMKKNLQAVSKGVGSIDVRLRLSVWDDQGTLKWAIVRNRVSQKLKKMQQEGIRLVVATQRKNRGRLSSSKTLNYAQLLAAYKGAQRAGAQEALILNSKSEVVEGSRSNIFFVKRGVLHTPALQSGCLAGITRTFVLAWAREEKRLLTMSPFHLRELMRADEVFCTNAIMEIVPVIEVEGHMIGKGRRGDVTQAALAAYKAQTRSHLITR